MYRASRERDRIDAVAIFGVRIDLEFKRVAIKLSDGQRRQSTDHHVTRLHAGCQDDLGEVECDRRGKAAGLCTVVWIDIDDSRRGVVAAGTVDR